MITFLLAHTNRETSSINILVSFRGKKYRRSTKESVPAKYGNQGKRRAKTTRDFTLAADINESLDKWEIAAMKTVAEFKEYQTPPSSAEFFARLDFYFYKDADSELDDASVATTFLEALDEYLRTQRLSNLRISSYAVLRRTIERYQLYRHTPPGNSKHCKPTTCATLNCSCVRSTPFSK